MMIGGLGLRREPVHERDRLEKILECTRFGDLVAFKRPAVQRFDALLGFGPG